MGWGQEDTLYIWICYRAYLCSCLRAQKLCVPPDRDGWALSALILESCHSSGIKYADQAFHGRQALLSKGGVFIYHGLSSLSHR